MQNRGIGKTGRRAGAVLAAAALAGLFGSAPALAAPPAQGANLLINPGFEPFTTPDGKYDYPLYVTPEGGGHIAEGWSPWWYNDPGPEYAVPEYDIAPIYRDPVRVRSGNAAQQIFRPSVMWKAGVYQRVAVPANAPLQFTIYGHTWSGFCRPTGDGGSDCGDNHDSNYGLGANPTTLRIGIDPTGGTDWASPNIVWSADYNIHDHFEQLVVSARAQGGFVTVFTYTTFQYPAVINNVYWDDAALVVTAGAAAPAAPVPAPPPAGGSGQLAQPTITMNVRSGPGLEHPVIAQISPGSSFPVTGQSGLWYAITYNGQTAYVYGPLVLVFSASQPTGTSVEAVTGLNVRAGPGTNHPVIGVIFPGAAYPIVDQAPGWYAITYQGQKGWVSALYVTVR